MNIFVGFLWLWLSVGHCGFVLVSVGHCGSVHCLVLPKNNLHAQALLRPCLKYFDPNFSKMTKPQAIITSPAGNPYEVNECMIQLRMLSRHYPDDWLTRHWSDNKSGVCLLCHESTGDLGHILYACTRLSISKLRAFQWWLSFCHANEPLKDLLNSKIESDCCSF